MASRQSSSSSSSSRGAVKVPAGGEYTVTSQGYSVPGTGVTGQVTTHTYQGPATVTTTSNTTTLAAPYSGAYTGRSAYSASGGQQYQTSTAGAQYSAGGGQYTTSGATTHYAGGALQQQQQQHYVSGQVVSNADAAGRYVSSSSRVVTGEERVIGFNTRVDESRISVISEKIVEHEIKVPKRIIHEDVIEKTIIVPETIVREEIIEEKQKVRETIVEVAKPIIVEKTVEVPEYVYVDKIIEVPERVVEQKIREVPRVEYRENIIEVPKIVPVERVREVPNVVYRDVPVEKIVEVPEIVEQVVVREVPVPQYVDKPVPNYVNVEVPQYVDRQLPVPVEAILTYEYRLPKIKPRVNTVKYPVYVPRFVQVPVAHELLDASLLSIVEQQEAQLAGLMGSEMIGLCEVENLAANIRKSDVHARLAGRDFQSAFLNAWETGRIQLHGGHTHATTGALSGYRDQQGYESRPHHSQHHKKSRKNRTSNSYRA